jgi:hypothetical protein
MTDDGVDSRVTMRSAAIAGSRTLFEEFAAAMRSVPERSLRARRTWDVSLILEP